MEKMILSENKRVSGDFPDNLAAFQLYDLFKEATRLVQKYTWLLVSLNGVFYIPFFLVNLLIFVALRPTPPSFNLSENTSSDPVSHYSILPNVSSDLVSQLQPIYSESSGKVISDMVSQYAIPSLILQPSLPGNLNGVLIHLVSNYPLPFLPENVNRVLIDLGSHYPIPPLKIILLIIILKPFAIALSLLLLTAMAYAVGCIYSSAEPSFRCVLEQIPCRWPRVAITFVFSSSIVLFLEAILSLILVFIFHLLRDLGVAYAGFIAASLFSVAISGILYISVLWILSAVVPVQEETYGREALVRSAILIVGKQCAALGFILIFEILSVFGAALLQGWIVSCRSEYLIVKVFVLFVLVSLGGVVTLYANVMVTVLYFSAKAFHGSWFSSGFVQGYSLLTLPA